MTLIEFELLLLLMIANGAPILTARLLGERLNTPIDLGCDFVDGRRWLGTSKTWRGLAASLLLTTAAALLMGLSTGFGMLLAGSAMLGDMLASFIKRRLGIASSGMALGLDQIPEALLPLLITQPVHRLGLVEMLVISLVFLVLELLLSRILFVLRIRKQPY